VQTTHSKIELMTRAYLLDTQIVSYMTRRDPLVLLYDDVLEHDSRLLISVQTEAEILFGCLKAGWVRDA